MAPSALDWLKDSVDVLLIDEDHNVSFASDLCLRVYDVEKPSDWEGRNVAEVMDEYEEKHHSKSAARGNGAKGIIQALGLAKQMGHYTATFWMLNKREEMLRMLGFTRYDEGKGYTSIVVPMEDPSMGAFTGFSSETGRISSDVADDFYSFEDLEIYDCIVAGMSYKEASRFLGIPKERVKYRVERIMGMKGTGNIAKMRQHYVAATRDFTIPSLSSIVCGACELHVPELNTGTRLNNK